jgi:TetR/AcrR family transcriptional regulator, regulator of autoinduction and epiphytic fitness
MMQDIVDGRTARRDRNRVAVLDAARALFSEGILEPSPDQLARRSGVSLRSIYRYVADDDDLIRAAIDRHLEVVGPLFVIERIGEGDLEHRIEAFVGCRMRVYEAIASTARAARLRAPTNAVIRKQLEDGRRRLGGQLELQFAAELDRPNRRAVVAAADALTQIETIDLYRVHRGLSAKETRAVLRTALRALLRAPDR